MTATNCRTDCTAPRLEHPFVTPNPDSDSRHGNHQVAYAGIAVYELDGTAVRVLSVRVETVIVYVGDDYSRGIEADLTEMEGRIEARWIIDALNGDDEWMSEAYEAARREAA